MARYIYPQKNRRERLSDINHAQVSWEVMREENPRDINQVRADKEINWVCNPLKMSGLFLMEELGNSIRNTEIKFWWKKELVRF